MQEINKALNAWCIVATIWEGREWNLTVMFCFFKKKNLDNQTMVFVYVFSIKGARHWGQFQFYTENKSNVKHILRPECKDTLKADWSNAKSYLLPFNKPQI